MTPLQSAILSLHRLRAATRRGLASAECQRADAIKALRQFELTGITVCARLLLRHLEHGGMVDAVWVGAVIADLELLLLDEDDPPTSDTERSPPSEEMAVVYDVSLEDAEATAEDTAPYGMLGAEPSEEALRFYAALSGYPEAG